MESSNQNLSQNLPMVQCGSLECSADDQDHSAVPALSPHLYLIHSFPVCLQELSTGFSTARTRALSFTMPQP